MLAFFIYTCTFKMQYILVVPQWCLDVFNYCSMPDPSNLTYNKTDSITSRNTGKLRHNSGFYSTHYHRWSIMLVSDTHPVMQPTNAYPRCQTHSHPYTYQCPTQWEVYKWRSKSDRLLVSFRSIQLEDPVEDRFKIVEVKTRSSSLLTWHYFIWTHS